jgi:hypothetical protein
VRSLTSINEDVASSTNTSRARPLEVIDLTISTVHLLLTKIRQAI